MKHNYCCNKYFGRRTAKYCPGHIGKIYAMFRVIVQLKTKLIDLHFNKTKPAIFDIQLSFAALKVGLVLNCQIGKK